MTAWVRLLVLLAALKSAVAVGMSLAPAAVSPPAGALLYSVPQYATLILAFSVTGLLLILARTSDVRALWLGCVLLLTATPFADTLLTWSSGPPLAATFGRLLLQIQVGALLPVFLWLFLREFPQPDRSSGARTWPRRAATVTHGLLALTIVLIASNLSELFWPLGAQSSFDPRRFVSRHGSGSFYWPLVIGLTLPGLAILTRKARASPVADRRRITVFVTGLVLGFAPITIEVLLETISARYASLVTESGAQAPIALAIFISLVAVPLVTAYSVIVDRVVEIHLVIRSALQYALAKHTLLAIIAIPLAGLGWYLYRHRDETVLSLLLGSGPLVLAAAAVAAALALRIRRRALNALDRRFFREHYDARRILIELIERCGVAATVDELVSLVAAEIDRALHLESVTVLIATPDGSVLRSADGRVRPLRRSSSLALLVGGDSSPLLVNLEHADSALRRLPEDERDWLADGAFELLVGLRAADGGLIGMIGLGSKHSEMPFSREDRFLLETIAASVALAIDNRRLRDSGPPVAASGALAPPAARPVDDGRAATECQTCGRVHPSDAVRCDCGGDLVESFVPYVLAGKFQFDRRLGSGGMGVVYQALDLDLGRQVAIKTLPHMNPEDGPRLRREAKAMAAVQHENLAVIFGAETWRGTPMLVVELLTAGTLAARLGRGVIPPGRALAIVTALTRAVEHLHEAGIVHGDIKPSNIGFARHDVPKLLDFGVARILRDAPIGGDATTQTASGELADAPQYQRKTGTRAPGGTPLYMSPEALDGKPAGPSVDVWSLTVVLFEAIAGVPPFCGSTVALIRQAVRMSELEDVRTYCPECPASVADFLRSALSPRGTRRPRTAADLHAALLGLRAALNPG